MIFFGPKKIHAPVYDSFGPKKIHASVHDFLAPKKTLNRFMIWEGKKNPWTFGPQKKPRLGLFCLGFRVYALDKQA